MLNTLVNSTGEGLCNHTSAYYNQSCIDEIFECIGTVQCQTDMNTEALEQIHDSLQTTDVLATNVLANSVCSSSICTNAVTSIGIETNNVNTQCLNVAGKATVGSIESNGIVKAESIQTQSLSTENITGLQSLTVEGGVWADDVRTDALEVNGKAVAECIETDEISTESLKSDIISTSEIGADSVVSDRFIGQEASIQKACVGSLSTSCFSSDEIATSKINSTSLSVPKVETSGGITGKGTIDTTSPVWKEIKIPLFTGTVQFYTDEWKVTINGGREFIWEDESLDHLKFLSNDGETVTIAVDWDGDVYYTYNVAKEEPILSFADNTGHTPDNDHTYIMQDSGIKRGTVFIYQDKEFTDQGLTVLGKVKASNLEITCGESIDCLCVGNLCVGNSIRSDNPIEVDICARSFCVSSPCTYIDNCLYADHLEANCICSNGHLWANHLYFDMIQMVHCAESPKRVVVYKNGLLCDSYKVCVDDDTVYSQKSCACDFYGNLHGKADDTCCFDGRLFCDACFEILSGKACTAGLADNSCCFEGRTFSNACLEILSGKACTAELADMAKKVCIGCFWAGEEAEWGYIPFVEPYTGCLVQARMDTGYGNPIVAYNEYGLLCLEIRGCVCVKDDPLIANESIATRYLKADDMRVCSDALITRLCSCEEYTKRLDVSQCAKFHGPTYFYGNIYQCGASYCTHAQNIYTCSDTITMREGADFAGDARIKVLKYDGTNNGVIQLGTDGTLRIGDETNCQPVLTRSEEADIADGHVLVWDATARCAKDGGDAIVTCDYVHCVGKECKTAACTYAVSVGTACKNVACNYATSVGTQCKNVSCAFAVSCGHEIGTSCKNAACTYAVSVGTQCKTAACTYASSVGTQCKSAACAFAVSCGHEIGASCKNASCDYAVSVGGQCKTAACTYATSVGTQCKNAACSFAVACGHKIGTSCKTASCTYATSVGAECKAAACDYAYGIACLCKLDAEVAACNYAVSVGCQCKDVACAFAVSCGHEIGTSCKTAACTYASSVGGQCKTAACTYATSVGTSCKTAACNYASSVGTECKNAACSFAVSCGHEIGTACKNAAASTKANCYGNNYNCVQCSNLTRKVDLEAYNEIDKRFIYLGQPNATKNIGCYPNLWFCPTCNVMVMGGESGSALCLIGWGSCCMSGTCEKRNPKVIFTALDSQRGCLQFSQYDSIHPGAGLCWATNQPSTWFQTDCVYANEYLDKNGNKLGGYCTTIASAGGTTRYVLLDLGKVEAMIDFQVYNNTGTIVKTTGDASPVGNVNQLNNYGVTGYCSIGTSASLNTCFWLRINGWRPFTFFGSSPIKVVSNTTTDPGCTWQSPVIFPTCNYVHCVGTQCKSASCSFAVSCGHEIGTTCGTATCNYTDAEVANAKTAACTYSACVGGQCKSAACTYASSVGTQCKTAACTFAVACGHEIGTSCKNAACTYAASVGGQCKTAACTYSACVGGQCKTAACTYSACVGGQCKNAACSYAASCADSIGTSCKNAACTYADTVAFCNVNTCKGIGVMGVARAVDAQCWTKAGYWAYMTTKDGPNCCWNHVIKTDWNGSADVWASGISIPTYNAPQNGIHYKVRCCGGTTGWTLVPDISCVQNVGLSCRNIAEACACAFAATCAQSVVPETSTFAKCYGNSTNCVAYADKIRVGVSSGNTFYKIPFTGTTGTTTSDQSLYMDSANAFPSYNPSTNVSCDYTLCVAQTLAVRNANGGFRLGNYCIYIA